MKRSFEEHYILLFVNPYEILDSVSRDTTVLVRMAKRDVFFCLTFNM